MRKLWGMDYPLMEKNEDDLNGSGAEETEAEKEARLKAEEEANSGSTRSESEDSPFTHPLLKGKTPAQVEEIFAAHAATVREQGRRLSDLENAPARRDEPAPVPTKKVTFDEFATDPDTAIATVVRREMGEIISPFRENLAEQQAAGAWAELGEEYPDYKDYKDIMQDILSEHGIPAKGVNVKTLRSTYIMARGRAVIEGRTVNKHEEEGERKPTHRRAAPPQHDPSKQVLPTGGGDKRVRKLSESEREVAKLQGYPDSAEGHAAYIRDLEMDEGNVATWTPPAKK